MLNHYATLLLSLSLVVAIRTETAAEHCKTYPGFHSGKYVECTDIPTDVELSALLSSSVDEFRLMERCVTAEERSALEARIMAIRRLSHIRIRVCPQMPWRRQDNHDGTDAPANATACLMSYIVGRGNARIECKARCRSVPSDEEIERLVVISPEEFSFNTYQCMDYHVAQRLRQRLMTAMPYLHSYKITINTCAHIHGTNTTTSRDTAHGGGANGKVARAEERPSGGNAAMARRRNAIVHDMFKILQMRARRLPPAAQIELQYWMEDNLNRVMRRLERNGMRRLERNGTLVE